MLQGKTPLLDPEVQIACMGFIVEDERPLLSSQLPGLTLFYLCRRWPRGTQRSNSCQHLHRPARRNWPMSQKDVENRLGGGCCCSLPGWGKVG